jgi:hypothetical protein
MNDNIAISYFSHMTAPAAGEETQAQICDDSIYGL